MSHAQAKAVKEMVRRRYIERGIAAGAASDPEVREGIARIVEEVAEESGIGLDVKELSEACAADFLGLGPLEPLLSDPSITEIMVNGGGVTPDGSRLAPRVFVERGGVCEEAPWILFDEPFEESVRAIADRIVSRVGRRLDEASPTVDATLPDGSRVNCSIPPVSVDGTAIDIRKFSRSMAGIRDMIAGGALTLPMAQFLQACVEARVSILVSGGTGSGKTTMLNALSSFIPEHERVVTIEDAVELQIDQRNLVRMQARPANSEGAGRVTVHDLVVNALRQRPDRIIVGECRSDETLEMLQAMQTGHDGSMTTVHANNPAGVFARIETMVMNTGTGLPSAAIRRQISEAIELIVHVQRCPDGRRRVSSITAVGSMEGDAISRLEIFRWDGARHAACGMQPDRVRAKIEAAGVPYDRTWFLEER